MMYWLHAIGLFGSVRRFGVSISTETRSLFTTAKADSNLLGDNYFALGNIAIDDLVFADGSTHWGAPGGAAVYAALGMRLWQHSVQLIAPLGADYPLAALADKVGFSACRPIGATMRNWGLYEDDGTRRFVPRRAAEDWSAFSPVPGDLTGHAYTYCHLAPMPVVNLLPLIAVLRERGARVISLDMQDRELRDVQGTGLRELLHAVDIFLPSRQDVEAIGPAASAVDALHALRRFTPTTAVVGVKCGADGAIVHAAGAAQYVALPSAAVRAIDATGAGDAFCGGFLAGYAATGDVAEAALQATVAASFALDAIGPFALATASAGAAQNRLAALRPRLDRQPFDVLTAGDRTTRATGSCNAE